MVRMSKSSKVFKRTASGTDVIPGPHHPALIDWDGQPDLGLLFAEGVLG